MESGNNQLPSTSNNPRVESRGTKRIKNKPESSKNDIVLKDIILLPSPEYENVPRGKERQTLYNEGYVASAFEIHGNWSEDEAILAIGKQFEEKLKDNIPPRFEFVRAVGNTIVKPQITSEQGWTGKVIKQQTGQAPLYIRATKKILEIDSEDDVASKASSEDGSYFTVQDEPNDETVDEPSSQILADNEVTMIERLRSIFPNDTEERLQVVVEGSSTLGEAVNKMIDEENGVFFNASEENLYENHLSVSSSVSSADNDVPPNLQSIILELEPLEPSYNRITISRESIFSDSIATFKNPAFDMRKPCKIFFENEPAVDGGGPRREYFTLLLSSLLSPNIPVRLFEGQSNRILPIHNADALRAHIFQVAGKMITSSIVNGCPSFPYFSPTIYTYLVSNSIEAVLEVVTVDDIPDIEVLDCIQQIENYVDGTQVDKSIADCLTNAGFTKTLTVENKGEAMMTVMLHCVILSRKAELDQLADGLGPLLEKIRNHPEICKPLLVHGTSDCNVTVEKLKSLLLFDDFLSEHLKKYLVDYIEMKDEQRLSEFLMFCSGTSTIPPLGFHDPAKITVSEIDSVLPNVNTCPMIVELPSRVSSYVQFCDALDTAISCQSHGFGIM